MWCSNFILEFKLISTSSTQTLENLASYILFFKNEYIKKYFLKSRKNTYCQLKDNIIQMFWELIDY